MMMMMMMMQSLVPSSGICLAARRRLNRNTPEVGIYPSIDAQYTCTADADADATQLSRCVASANGVLSSQLQFTTDLVEKNEN